MSNTGNNFTTSSEIHHVQYSVLPLKLPVMKHLCWLVILCMKVVQKLQHKTTNWSFLGLFPAIFVIRSETRSITATPNYPRLRGQRPSNVLKTVEHWELQKKQLLDLLAICYCVSLSQAMQVKSNTLKCALCCCSKGLFINGPFTGLWCSISKSYVWCVWLSKAASSILHFTLRSTGWKFVNPL